MRYNPRFQSRKRCYFCQQRIEPDPNDERQLKNFLSMNGRIQPRERTGLCRTHQKLIAKAIKRARQMALISY